MAMIKCIFSNIMKLTTWICAFLYEGLQFVSSAIMTAYRARRQEQDHIDNQVDSQVTRPFIPASLSFNERPVTHQNEVELCDPSTSIECPAVPTVSD